MREITIRQATLEDTEFLVAGNAAMALETEARALDIHTLRAGVYAHVDSQARQRANVCGLRLYVESHNHRAQAVYHRCGMHEAVYRMFETDYSTTPQPAARTI